MEDKKTLPAKNDDTMIYKINYINGTNKAVIKLYGMLKNDKKISDEIIRSFGLDNFKCDVIEKIFTSDELIGNSKIPVLYATVYYSKGSINMEVVKYVLFFNSNDKINENSINVELDGKYTLEVFSDKEGILLKEYDKFSKKTKMIDEIVETVTIKKNKEVIARIFKSRLEKIMGRNDIDNRIPEPSIIIEN